MGAVSFRFFSETASAEGLLNSSVSLLLLRDLTLYLGALPLLYPGPAFPTLACPFSSLKDISILNHITSLTHIIPFNLNHFIISLFLFRVELSIHALSLVFRSSSLSLIILLNSSSLAFSSNPLPNKTGSPKFTTVSHNSSLKSSSEDHQRAIHSQGHSSDYRELRDSGGQNFSLN